MRQWLSRFFLLWILFLSLMLSACGSSGGGVFFFGGGDDDDDGPVNLWTWMSGSDVINQAGVYGVKGTPDAANVPGARGATTSWVDAAGNLWLFGGIGYDANEWGDNLNDLWKFNPSTGQWTWVSGADEGDQPGVYGVKGTPDADNVPGARRGAAGWVDGEGNFWLFGGMGYDYDGEEGNLNDLWKFTPSTGQWTWVSGSNERDQAAVYGVKGTPDADNVPGARRSTAGWVDGEGNFWIFGGMDLNMDALNDLWRFNPSTGEWTWMSGATVVNQQGVYGDLGQEHEDNMPGARWSPVRWIDQAGNLRLFGGLGVDSRGLWCALNDMWRFNPSTGQWTWIAGSDEGDQPGVYGVKGTPDAANIPGGRYDSSSWIDATGNLWLFGGYGFDFEENQNFLNDLWKFNSSTGQWTWVSGSETVASSGIYDDADPAANIAGARSEAVSWFDPAGNLWLFGGFGLDSSENMGPLNDLWCYEP